MAKTATRGKGKDTKKPRPLAAKKPRKLASRPKEAEEEPEKSGSSASEVIAGLLESPLVADVLAAGAAAALASITHHKLTRRRESSSKQALKDAAKSAAAAMGARLSEEFEDILDKAKKAKAEAR